LRQVDACRILTARTAVGIDKRRDTVELPAFLPGRAFGIESCLSPVLKFGDPLRIGLNERAIVGKAERLFLDPDRTTTEGNPAATRSIPHG
jgi:hypothetical protein